MSTLNPLASTPDAELLAALKRVDGANSGLDADTLDGLHASGFVQTAALQGMHFYTTPAQLGVGNMPTLQQLYDALPDNSLLIFTWNAKEQCLSDAPAAIRDGNWGLGVFIRAVTRAQFFFISGDLIYTHYVNRVAANYHWVIMPAGTIVSSDQGLPGPEIMDDPAGGVILRLYNHVVERGRVA